MSKEILNPRFLVLKPFLGFFPLRKFSANLPKKLSKNAMTLPRNSAETRNFIKFDD